ncbi:hemagglutinin/amebocyte aggregation factor-like [Engraulis encrasicolus]|uniref:hemagglutinin/amebocyte aggregation factor-like n=1 Tax=Engraulis encrasicolus TaxID=184585 RepID=UPI002FD36ACA
MGIIQILFLFIAPLLIEAKDLRWQNSFDEALFFHCPTLESISYIMSEHNNHHEDRLWDFHCQKTFTQTPSCFTTNWVNDFDDPLDFQCPSNSVITGMESYHDNRHEDRRWKFTCCNANYFCTGNCEWSGYVNDFDAIISWGVPSGHYLAGVSSYHENHHEDRRWKYLTCKNTC